MSRPFPHDPTHLQIPSLKCHELAVTGFLVKSGTEQISTWSCSQSWRRNSLCGWRDSKHPGYRQRDWGSERPSDWLEALSQLGARWDEGQDNPILLLWKKKLNWYGSMCSGHNPVLSWGSNAVLAVEGWSTHEWVENCHQGSHRLPQIKSMLLFFGLVFGIQAITQSCWHTQNGAEFLASTDNQVTCISFPPLHHRDKQTEVTLSYRRLQQAPLQGVYRKVTGVPRFQHGYQEINSEDHENSAPKNKATADKETENSYQLENSVPEWRNVCSNVGCVKLRFSWDNGRTGDWCGIRTAHKVQPLNRIQSESRATVNSLSWGDSHVGEVGENIKKILLNNFCFSGRFQWTFPRDIPSLPPFPLISTSWELLQAKERLLMGMHFVSLRKFENSQTRFVVCASVYITYARICI